MSSIRKQLVAVFVCTTAVLAAMVVLYRLVTVSPVARELTTPSSSTGPPVAATTRAIPLDRRISIAADKPIEPGLPPWTIVLATMPVEVPPPAATTPPEVPEAALPRR